MSHRPWPEGAKGLRGGSSHTNNRLLLNQYQLPEPTSVRSQSTRGQRRGRQSMWTSSPHSHLSPTIPSPPPRLIPVPTPAVGVFCIFQSQKTAPLSGSFNPFGQNLSLPNYRSTFCIDVVKNPKVCFQVHKRLK